MGGRGKSDKSQRRNHNAVGKPGSLDQFGKKLDEKRMAVSPNYQIDNERGG
ncbi:hypothetical protein ABE137_18290 [Brevibacillus laterosporus]|uniref:Uncharacterized protein n=1 Tax=Brevibacillus halotolerans TaxID=1507437 RepID=A0ABT4HZC8_9BACL|nr:MULTISPECIES: hypothetical protein [Brevibacillus]MCR8986429.1 hypothetical protein [Brevibacillus laterosporus]MCZ0832164.1 hypothetical protein [Brevibacillus halotolerans]GIO02353.1 hypothetical protein J5TS2_30210 [Brevibacillus halotolerans]